LSDVNIDDLLASHKNSGKLATMTAVTPPGRYGALDLDGNDITNFMEKPKGDGGRINGGYFVLNPKVIDYIDGDATLWENEPLTNLAQERQLNAYFHDGFWQPMDTLRERNYLEDLWSKPNPPWKVWG